MGRTKKSAIARAKTTGFPPRRRDLNHHDDGKMYIPPDGQVSYYDNGDPFSAYNYLDGRRVKISNTVFRDNESNEDGSVVFQEVISDENVDGEGGVGDCGVCRARFGGGAERGEEEESGDGRVRWSGDMMG